LHRIGADPGQMRHHRLGGVPIGVAGKTAPI